MKLKFNGFLAMFLLLMSQLTYAQDKSVSGTVTDQSGLPLPGVNVLVKGTQNGTQTDFDGKFKVADAQEKTLVFSFTGMKTMEASASNGMKVKMADDSVQLEGVVVTAFGIKRKPSDLGYSVSSVKAADITENSEPDLVRSLSGKVAGVNVNFSTGVAGAANQIVVRGVSSLTGNTQPLIIVDGISYSTNEITTSSQITGGGGYESALSTLDPNDIETINVLKSAASAALYGSRAANGVIVITTKSGSGKSKKAQKLNVTVGTGVYFENIANLPEYQNTYGAGANFTYANANGSWGPRFDTPNPAQGVALDGTIPTWAPILTAFPQIGPRVKYEAKPDNVKDLFRTGTVLDRTIGFNYSGQDGNFSGTISDLRQEGYIPFNTYDRTSMSVGGNFKLNKKLTMGGNMSYSRTKQVGGFFGENQFNGSSSSFARTLFLARNWDLNLPYIDPITGGSVTPNGTQFDHPLWSWENDQIITNTNRTVAGLNLNYLFNDNISATYRVGLNRYNLARNEIRDIASRASNALGNIRNDNFINEDIESTLLFNFNYKLSESFGFEAILGNNVLQNNNSQIVNEGREIVLPEIFTLNNTKTVVNLLDERFQKRNVGVFADATVSYKNYLFLNATGRNDWSSSLPKSNNSYFYPSLSASFVLTEALKTNSDILTYAKFRGSYAKIGRDAAAEFTRRSFVLGTAWNNQSTIGNSTFLADPNVEPEFSTETEFGTELEFFKKRIGIDLTFYNRKTTNLITELPTAASSGFLSSNTNAGEMENKGIELALTLVPIKTNDFKWTFTTIFSQNRNEVISVGNGVERRQLNPNAVAYAIPGEAFGVFYGTKFARDANGNYLINPSGGGIIQSPELGIIGDPNADFRVSFTNAIAYKGFTLRSQFDWKQGGDVSSSTINTLLGRGVTKDTEDRERTFIIPGFYGNNDGTPLLDANNNQIPNTTQLSMNELYFSPAGGNTFGINSVDESEIYDGTVYRLRELSLTYDLPAKFLEKSPFGQISFSVMGNNLWYFAPNVPRYTNFDPDTTSYGGSFLQGIETSAAPTAKRYGFKINLTF
jgi:TonB-linked SusC/RagA family outer membrane protein